MHLSTSLQVAANELSAVDAVLSADVKRTELITEERRLNKLIEEGDTEEATRKAIDLLYVELEAIGAAAAEARARRILSVSSASSGAFLCLFVCVSLGCASCVFRLCFLCLTYAY